MGENARKIGDKLEEFAGSYLLTNFGWTELTRDREIKCIKAAHKNLAGNSKRTHGIDLLCKYDDPYYGGQAVIIECKNYQIKLGTRTYQQRGLCAIGFRVKGRRHR